MRSRVPLLASNCINLGNLVAFVKIVLTYCQGQNSGGRRYKVIVRNPTPFQSNVQCRGGMYLAMVERRL